MVEQDLPFLNPCWLGLILCEATAERERRCKILGDVLYERSRMRKKEYVKRIKRNLSGNTGTPEEENIKRSEW